MFLVGTLKMLIKNKNSRKAFFTFLEKNKKGKEELLDYFLFLEGIKKTKDPLECTNQFLEVVAKYQKQSEGKEPESNDFIIYASTHTWKDIKTLPHDELVKHIMRSQDEVLLAITPMFETFVKSDYYKDFEKDSKENERKSYASSQPVSS
jgi:hypothetical protein